jgi:hypothetical protein
VTLTDPRPDFQTTGIVPEWQCAAAILADSICGWRRSWSPVACCLSWDHPPAARLEGPDADFAFACVRVYLEVQIIQELVAHLLAVRRKQFVML